MLAPQLVPMNATTPARHEDSGAKWWRWVNNSGDGQTTVATGLTTVVTGEQQQLGANNSSWGLTTAVGGNNSGTGLTTAAGS